MGRLLIISRAPNEGVEAYSYLREEYSRQKEEGKGDDKGVSALVEQFR